MQAVDAAVISQTVGWLDAGERCWLATVVATWGSSPRPVGSVLVCNAQGRMVGSLSGGCVEDDLLGKLAAGALARERPAFHRYGVTAEESDRLGLPCGGHLDIVVEPLNVAHRDQFRHIAGRLAERRCTRRTLSLADATATVEDTAQFEAPAFDGARRILHQSFGPRYQLFIIGASMVSQYLAEIAQMLDFGVTVCDPRRELLDDFAVAGAHRICAMPDDAVKAHANDPRSAIVALTHDPRIDDMGLMEALQTQAFYVGAMGSARTSAARRERLRALDLSETQIARLHAPIGLPIGSKTPPEIAVAIVAEITAIRHRRERAAQDALAGASAVA